MNASRSTGVATNRQQKAQCLEVQVSYVGQAPETRVLEALQMAHESRGQHGMRTCSPAQTNLVPVSFLSENGNQALLATTWEKDIVSWWSTQSEDKWPPGVEEFGTFMKNSPKQAETLINGSWGNVELQGFDQNATADDKIHKHHYLLYVVFKIS